MKLRAFADCAESDGLLVKLDGAAMLPWRATLVPAAGFLSSGPTTEYAAEPTLWEIHGPRLVLMGPMEDK